ncbi:molybdate ABC transporter permease subunit [Metabacillus herbersteinensis]|uniref:Molybdenum transport system permease n=1 Tax=Metabacillus herbersteinensis TaxID=283816 RepID=A0ABV6GBE6_9BACI
MYNDFWIPLQLSIKISSVASFFVIILGIIIARLMARKSFRGKVLLETLFLLPLVLPPSVVGFFLVVFLGRNSFIGQGVEWLFNAPIIFTWWAGVIAAIVVAFPLMYQTAKTGFQAVDPEIEDASKVDGAGELKTFLHITLPLAMKSIVAGSLLSFARALGEFGATLMFAGNIPGKTQTVPTAIYVAMETGNMKLAWAWVLSMILISFIMLMIIHFFNKN